MAVDWSRGAVPLWEDWKCSGEGLELMDGVRSDATASQTCLSLSLSLQSILDMALRGDSLTVKSCY